MMWVTKRLDSCACCLPAVRPGTGERGRRDGVGGAQRGRAAVRGRLTPAQAAANFLPQTAAALVLTAATGAVADRMAPRVLIAAAMVLLASALVLAQTASPGWPALSFGLILGAASGAARTLEGALFPRFFGTAHLGAIRGLVMAVGVAASAFGPLLLALGYERTGSYGPMLTALISVPLAVGVTALFARSPDPALRQHIRRRLAAAT